MEPKEFVDAMRTLGFKIKAWHLYTEGEKAFYTECKRRYNDIITNQEILDNAPEGATHCYGHKYYKDVYTDDRDDYHREVYIDGHWRIDEGYNIPLPNDATVISDIKQIIEQLQEK